jgi:hypothetical protein
MHNLSHRLIQERRFACSWLLSLAPPVRIPDYRNRLFVSAGRYPIAHMPFYRT